MDASDIMTRNVISVDASTPVSEIVELMLEYRISAVPVVENGALVGIVSEGDLLRRSETKTERRRSRWLEFVTPNSSLAAEYVKTHGRKARNVMTDDVITVVEGTPIAQIADILESRQIKRVPVVRDKTLVGIVSRANLLQALASQGAKPSSDQVSDQKIRDALFSELAARKWAASPNTANIIVQDGEVHLWGIIQSEEERRAMIVAAENIPGVRRVEDHLSYPVPPLF